jgi:PEP-CTERM motif-containing protein
MRLSAVSVMGLLLFVGLGTAARADEFVVNGNFAPANPGAGYGAVPGWNETIASQGSNTSAGPFWDNGSGNASVTTVGFIQGDGSFSQTLTGLTPGATYTLSFIDNARLGAGCSPACDAIPSLTVLLDGSILIGATAVNPVGGANPFDSISINFIATSASELLDFSSTTPSQPGTNVGFDGTLLLSDVSVSTAVGVGTQSSVTPEPSSLMLLGTGILGVAGMMRRRFLV